MMDPADLSLRDAMTLASRLKMRVWIGLFAAAGTLLAGAFGAGRWWERTFAGNHPAAPLEYPPQGGTSQSGILASSDGRPRFVVDRFASRIKHGVTRVEATLSELPWREIPPGHFGFVLTKGPDIASMPVFLGFEDESYAGERLEVHKLKDGTYVALGYVSKTDSRKLELGQVAGTIHLYTQPNDEAAVFVDHVQLSQFRIANDRGMRDARVFDLEPRPAAAVQHGVAPDDRSPSAPARR